MTAQTGIRPAIADAPAKHSACAACLGFELNICRAAAEVEMVSRARPIGIEQSGHTVPARRIICREQDQHDTVQVICGGWAAAIVTLSDGSRQIVSFLLPGDMVSTTTLFGSRPFSLVEAITDVRYRTFNRAALKALVYRQPELLDKFAKAWVDEKAQAIQLIVDLGRRTAEERIARLIMSLVDRLAKRNMVRGEPIEFEFPLRQHHIADATGLTRVHVSKVLTEFRRDGLIKINERSVTILDLPGFRRVANMR